jgi:DNA-binding MarR family transcriptional regulator
MQTQPHFNGSTYQAEFDFNRLTSQIEAIFELMKDGKHRTLGEIESLTGYPQASISAQLRNLKKDRFGKHKLYKKRRGSFEKGHWEYQLILNI